MEKALPTLVSIIGVPGAGKTTLARELAQQGFVHLEADQIRCQLTGRTDRWTPLVWSTMQDQAIKHLNQHGDVVLDCTGTTVHYSSMISCIMTSATLVGRSLVVRLACSELSSVARGHKVPTSNFNWIAKAASRIAADVTIITDHELPTVASLNEHLVALHRKPLTGSAVARGEVAYDRRGHRKPFVPAVRKKRRSGNELP